MKEHHRKGRLGHAGFGLDIERGAGEQVMGRKDAREQLGLPTPDRRPPFAPPLHHLYTFIHLVHCILSLFVLEYVPQVCYKH